MSEYRSDEETVEVIARWWKENGAFLVGTLVVVIGGVLGWNWWQAQQQSSASDAASLYLSWERAAGSERQELAAQLAEAFPRSSYRALIAFDVAREALEDGQADVAKAALEEVLALRVPAAMHDLARIRLARIELDAEVAEAALRHLDAVTGDGQISLVEELRGDALRQLGRHDDALAAYERALAVAGSPRPLLEIKQEDLRGRIEGGRL